MRGMSAMRFFVTLLALTVGSTAQAEDPPVLSEMVSHCYSDSFTLTGELNGCYVIESSTNLIDWKAMSTNRYPSAKRTIAFLNNNWKPCLLYTSPSPRDS